MKTIFNIVMIFMFILCATASADEITHRATAEELAKLLQPDVVNMSVHQWETMAEQVFNKMEVPPDDQRTLLKKYSGKIRKLFEEQQGEHTNISISHYMETFTEDEIKYIISFYKSPAGQKLREKAAQFTEKLTEMLLKGAPEMSKKINQITDEMMQELKIEKKPAQDGPSRDEALQKQIIGKWAEGESPYGIAAFEEGGVYRAWIYESPRKASLIGMAKGKWWIKDGKLYNMVHETTPPLPPANPEEVIVDRIIDISDTTLTLIDKDGLQYTKDKVNE